MADIMVFSGKMPVTGNSQLLLSHKDHAKYPSPAHTMNNKEKLNQRSITMREKKKLGEALFQEVVTPRTS